MLCSALCGWGGAFVLSSLLLAKGEIKDMEDLRALLFLSLAPGVSNNRSFGELFLVKR